MHPPSTSASTSLLLLKKAIVVIDLLGGVAVAMRSRNVRVTAIVAVTAWAIGFGWLIVDTLV